MLGLVRKQRVKKHLIVFLISTLLMHTENVLSHTNDEINTQVTAFAALTWRSDEIVTSNEPYLIPGTLLGGEALAQHQGANLDEVRLGAIYKASDHYYIKASLASHHEEEITFESFSLVAPNISGLKNTKIELGKFESQVTPTATWHASSGTFSESSLLSDVFFGRHFIDTGARALLNIHTFTLGIEAFDGDRWPANNGEGTVTAFAKNRFNLNNSNIDVSVWAMDSNALNRFDNRYSTGHSHGGAQISTSVEDYRFSGDVLQYGLWIDASTTIRSITFSSQIEWIVSESEGTLANSTQQSLYKNNYEGYRLNVGAAFNKHSISIRHEEIALQNDFLSPIPPNFAENANLINNTFEPSKSVFSWSYSLNSDISIRVERAALKLHSPENENRTSIGITWKKPLLN